MKSFGRLSGVLVLSVGCWCGVLDGSLESAPPETEVTRDVVRRTVERLDSPTLADRQKAEADLEELGVAALPLLPPSELVKSPGAKQALQRVRGRLEHAAARLSIKASRITLKGDLSPLDVTRELERQTRNQVLLAQSLRDRRRPIACQWEDRPFWEVVTELERSGFALSFIPERGQFELAERSITSSPRPTQQQEALRFQLGEIIARRIPDRSEWLLQVPVTMAAEPRLRPLFLRYAARDFVLHNGDSHECPAFDPEAKFELPLGDGGRESQFVLRFVSPDQPTGHQHLKGHGTLLIAAEEQPIAFNQWPTSRGVARRRGGVTVTLAEVKLPVGQDEKNSVRFAVQVSYESTGRAFESHQTWIFHNKVYLELPSGERLAPSAAETLFQHEGGVGVEYRFQKLPPAAFQGRFVYVAPTLLIDVPLNVDLATDKVGLAGQ